MRPVRDRQEGRANTAMATEIRVPTLGESVVEATVGQWFKQAGEAVAADEPLVELETDKVTVEVPAPAAGVLSEIVVKAGETVEVGALLGAITAGDGAAAAAKRPKAAAARPAEPKPKRPQPIGPSRAAAEAQGAGARAAYPRRNRPGRPCRPRPPPASCLSETGLSAGEVAGSGRRGQVLKGDVIAAAGRDLARDARAQPKPPAPPRAPVAPDDAAREERVRMTRLRQTIAKRLKDAQDTAAMLTTFNDVDMSAIMQLRKEYRDGLREASRREARLHGLLREGLRAGAEGNSRRQRRDRRRGSSSTRTTTTSAWRSAPSAAWWCR